MKHIITVTKRSGDYMAHLDGDTRMWGSGATSYEAIGNLVSAHQKELGVEVKAEQLR